MPQFNLILTHRPMAHRALSWQCSRSLNQALSRSWPYLHLGKKTSRWNCYDRQPILKHGNGSKFKIQGTRYFSTFLTLTNINHLSIGVQNLNSYPYLQQDVLSILHGFIKIWIFLLLGQAMQKLRRSGQMVLVAECGWWLMTLMSRQRVYPG